jgi:hypothetical protein
VTATPVAQAFRPALRPWFGRVALIAVFVVTGGGARLLACPMCFGAEESSLIDGAKLGILVMLGITFAVQGAFVGFFLYLRKRARLIAEADLDSEWSELQRASRTS